MVSTNFQMIMIANVIMTLFSSGSRYLSFSLHCHSNILAHFLHCLLQAEGASICIALVFMSMPQYQKVK